MITFSPFLAKQKFKNETILMFFKHCDMQCSAISDTASILCKNRKIVFWLPSFLVPSDIETLDNHYFCDGLSLRTWDGTEDYLKGLAAIVVGNWYLKESASSKVSNNRTAIKRT